MYFKSYFLPFVILVSFQNCTSKKFRYEEGLLSVPKDTVTVFPNWLSQAKTAGKTRSDYVQVYVVENTLSTINALFNAFWQAKMYPDSNRILFFYSNKGGLFPNIKSCSKYGIHFVNVTPKSKSDDRYLGTNLYEPMIRFLKGRSYDLYVSEDFSNRTKKMLATKLYWLAYAKNIYLIEEGTFSYLHCRSGNYMIDDLLSVKNQFRKILSDIRLAYPMVSNCNHQKVYEKSSLHKGVEYVLQDFSYRFFFAPQHPIMWWLAQLPNVWHTWQYPASVHRSNTTSVPFRLNLKTMYDSLTPNEQKDFCAFFNCDIEKFKRKYCQSKIRQGITENLIIVSTVTWNNNLNYEPNKNEIKWLKMIIKKYKNTYNILFKPHPRRLAYYKILFEKLGIHSEDCQLIQEVFPVELLSLIGIGDKYISCISSALHFEGIPEKVDHIMSLDKAVPYHNEVWKILKKNVNFSDSQFINLDTLEKRWELNKP